MGHCGGWWLLRAVAVLNSGSVPLRLLRWSMWDFTRGASVYVGNSTLRTGWVNRTISGLVKDLMHKGHCGNFVMSFESTRSKAFVNTHNAPVNGTWCGGSLDLPGITACTTNRRARSIFATTRKWPTMVSHQS